MPSNFQTPGRRSPPAGFVSAPWIFPIAAAPIRDGAVVVGQDGSIIDVGARLELRARHRELPEQRADGAVLPALVNAHLHLELSPLARLRGEAGRGFIAWAEPVMQAQGRPPSRHTDPGDVLIAAAQAMKAAGVGSVGDVGNGLSAITALGDGSLGFEGTFFHELVGSRDAATGDAIADASNERNAYIEAHGWPPGIGYALAPHAPYSVGAQLFTRIFQANAQEGRRTSIHVAEDPDEIDLLLRGEGKWPQVLAALQVDVATRVPHMRPLAYLAGLGLFDGPPPLLVHMVLATQQEIALAAAHQATIVLCPRSNLHISGRLPNVPAMLQAGVALALGTDSLTSSPSLSPWGEIAVLREHFPDVGPEIWLRAATLGGSAALDLPHRGVIASGARPGLIAVSLRADPERLDDVLHDLVSNPVPNVQWLTPS